MDFADVLDGIAKPVPTGDEGSYRAAGAASVPFWQVLDQIGGTAPVGGARLKEAYFPDLPKQAPKADLPTPEELSLDPEEIAFELDISAVRSVEELSHLRRRFAMLNHPDRTAPSLRARANQRMTIANTLIDEAARKFAR